MRWIRQSIHGALRRRRRVTDFSAKQWENFKKIRNSSDELAKLSSEAPTLEAVSEELGFDPDRAVHAYGASLAEVPLDAPAFDLDNDVTWVSMLSSVDDVDATYDHTALADEVQGSLRMLNEREARVLRLYYGLQGEKPMRLEEIGALLGVTRERARQIRNRALEKCGMPAVTLSLSFARTDYDSFSAIAKENPIRSSSAPLGPIRESPTGIPSTSANGRLI